MKKKQSFICVILTFLFVKENIMASDLDRALRGIREGFTILIILIVIILVASILSETILLIKLWKNNDSQKLRKWIKILSIINLLIGIAILVFILFLFQYEACWAPLVLVIPEFMIATLGFIILKKRDFDTN